MRFFNGSKEAKPKSIDTKIGTKPLDPPLVDATPPALPSPNEVSTHYDDRGYTNIRHAIMSVVLANAPAADTTITVEVKLPTDKYLVELDVILVDYTTAGMVAAVAKYLWRGTAASGVDNATVSAAVAHSGKFPAVAGATAMDDITVFNNATTPLLAASTFSLFSTTWGLMAFNFVNPIATNGSIGIWKGMTWDDIKTVSASIVTANPPPAGNTLTIPYTTPPAAGETFFSSFLFVSGSQGSISVTSVNVVQSAALPYWAFK